MKATIHIDVPDAFLEQRVLEYAEELEVDEEAPTPRAYMETVLREVLVEDTIPIALFTWPLTATLVMDGSV